MRKGWFRETQRNWIQASIKRGVKNKQLKKYWVIFIFISRHAFLTLNDKPALTEKVFFQHIIVYTAFHLFGNVDKVVQMWSETGLFTAYVAQTYIWLSGYFDGYVIIDGRCDNVRWDITWFWEGLGQSVHDVMLTSTRTRLQYVS